MPVHDAQQITCLVYFVVESIDSVFVRRFELVENAAFSEMSCRYGVINGRRNSETS